MTTHGLALTDAVFTLDLHVDEVLNSNQRLHRHEGARRTAAIRNKAIVARLQNREPVFARAHCAAVLFFPDRRGRDHHNYMPTVKPAVDGIVTGPASAGRRWPHALLPDDDTTHLDGPDLRIGHDPAVRRGWVRLVLTFIEQEATA